MGKETVLSVVKELRDLTKELIKHLPGVVAPVKSICSKDGRFIRNSDGTVTDNQLKLIWYPTLEKKFTWEEAQKKCKKNGCRLPSTHELYSLVDVGKNNPAIDKEIFPDTKTDDWYWTSTPCAWSADFAWYVYFYYGGVYNGFKDSTNYVRPVRSSQ